MTKQEFINQFYTVAKEACAGTPIFPILALAEAAVESGWATSQLSLKAFNFYGVKAFSTWHGKMITMPTKEYNAQGQPYMIDAAFRAYDNPVDSFKDYVAVVEESRYAATGTLTATTPQEQIKDIAAGGYSTSSTYAQLITEIISEIEPLIQGFIKY